MGPRQGPRAACRGSKGAESETPEHQKQQWLEMILTGEQKSTSLYKRKKNGK